MCFVDFIFCGVVGMLKNPQQKGVYLLEMIADSTFSVHKISGNPFAF